MSALQTDETPYYIAMTASRSFGSLTVSLDMQAPLNHVETSSRSSGRLANNAGHFFPWIEIEPMRYFKAREILQLKRTAAMLAIAIAVATSTGATNAGAAELAQQAHDTYCIACHDASVYTRDDRLAGDSDALRAQVDRWQGTISLSWSDEEIDRMASWLAKRYYRMDCPHHC